MYFRIGKAGDIMYEYRYKYEKEHLKRIALDVNRENEYIPFKEMCDALGIPVSRKIRDLMKEALENYKRES